MHLHNPDPERVPFLPAHESVNLTPLQSRLALGQDTRSDGRINDGCPGPPTRLKNAKQRTLPAFQKSRHTTGLNCDSSKPLLRIIVYPLQKIFALFYGSKWPCTAITRSLRCGKRQCFMSVLVVLLITCLYTMYHLDKSILEKQQPRIILNAASRQKMILHSNSFCPSPLDKTHGNFVSDTGRVNQSKHNKRNALAEQVPNK